jgi:hypothetical protein
MRNDEMTKYDFPSDTFPAFPSVEFDADAEWVEAQAPGAVISLVRSVAPGQFAPNLVVTETRHTPDFDLGTLLDDVAREAVERDGSADEPPFTATIHGREYAGRVIAFRDPIAGTLAQVHMATRVDRLSLSDVVHVVGTCSGDRVADDLPLLREVMSSVTVTVPAAATEA